MILMIDNYDSFTYNLVQYLGELGAEVETVRNDTVSLADIIALKPEGIVISPSSVQAVISRQSGRDSRSITREWYRVAVNGLGRPRKTPRSL